MTRVLSAFMLCALLMTGCAIFSSGPYADFRNADSLYKEKKYSEAAASYKKALKDSTNPKLIAKARFGLARTLAYYDNPQRDYAQALLEFEEFLRSYPDHEKAADAQNWRAVLKALHEARKENDNLNKSIEQLKRLDVRHEEKRKMR